MLKASKGIFIDTKISAKLKKNLVSVEKNMVNMTTFGLFHLKNRIARSLVGSLKDQT